MNPNDSHLYALNLSRAIKNIETLKIEKTRWVLSPPPYLTFLS